MSALVLGRSGTLSLAVAALWPPVAVGVASAALSAVAWDAGGVPAMLAKWTPLLLKGFMLDVGITAASMALGTFLGVLLGMAAFANWRVVRMTAWSVIQLLRNTPGLVFLFFIAFTLPFSFTVLGVQIAFPDWEKAVLAFSLKIMANVAEVVRGAVRSVPAAQWEAAESLAFTKGQIFRIIILPQCVGRMIPPWMNICALFFTAVPLASLIGVEDAVTCANLALKAEMRPEFVMPLYLYVLSWFFVAAFSVNRLAVAMEKATVSAP